MIVADSLIVYGLQFDPVCYCFLVRRCIVAIIKKSDTLFEILLLIRFVDQCFLTANFLCNPVRAVRAHVHFYFFLLAAEFSVVDLGRMGFSCVKIRQTLFYFY
jgi:hypothetical protein